MHRSRFLVGVVFAVVVVATWFVSPPAASAREVPSRRAETSFALVGQPIEPQEAVFLDSSSMTTAALATTSCWAGVTDKVSRNAVGQVRFHARMSVEWCASGGKVISNGLRRCSNLGGFLEFTGCSTSRGTLNLSSVSIFGDWNYRFGCCGVYTTYGANLEMRAYATGTYTGTWYWT